MQGAKELRILAQSFNHMAQKLRESFRELEIVNQELEERSFGTNQRFKRKLI